MELVVFLLARIAEDEAVARAARDDDLTNAHMLGLAEGSALSPGDRVMVHPTRVLAECEAKRRIVASYQGASSALARMNDPLRRGLGEAMVLAHGDALRALALPYAEHPDYDEAWRPHV